MRKGLYLILLMASLSTCTDTKSSEEYQNLLVVKEHLEEELERREQYNRDVIHAMTQIEDNLAAIREREMGIVNVKNQSGANQKDRITLIVSEIGTYFEENRNIIRKLENQVKSHEKRNSELDKLVAFQKRTILEKEKQIQELLKKVSELNVRLEVSESEKNRIVLAKEAELDETLKELDEKEAVITTAYYKYGTKKELLSKGIIKKDGGVLGIGKTIALSNKLSTQTFIPLNINNTAEINLGFSEKQQIISVHPNNSYYFVKANNGASFLKITNPERFWSISKFLVIVTE